MKFFVLAGGKGTRMAPYSDVIPKCLIPVAGKPCVRWVIEDIIDQGFNDIILCINKEYEPNYRHEFRDIAVKFSVSEEPLGTVGEILCAKKLIDGAFVLRYGDDLTEIDYRALIDFHKKEKATTTLVLTTNVPLSVGVAKLDGSRIVEMREKPPLGLPSWAAIAVLEPKVISYFKLGEDIAGDALPNMIEAGEKVCGFMIDSLWLDVGNVEHWRRADAYYRRNNQCD